MRWIAFAFLLFNFVLHAEPVEFELDYSIPIAPHVAMISRQFIDINDDQVDELVLVFADSENDLLISKEYDTSGSLLDTKTFFCYPADLFGIKAEIGKNPTGTFLICCFEADSGSYNINLYNYLNQSLIDEFTFPALGFRYADMEFVSENDELFCLVGVLYSLIDEDLSILHKFKIENEQLIEQSNIELCGCSILPLNLPGLIASVGSHGYGDEGYWTDYYETHLVDYNSME